MRPEVLAPAGSHEAAVAAIRAGADAIYLGTQHFSARRNATNFDLEELRSVLEYAHRYEVRVYVAVNILIRPEEFAQAIDLLGQLNRLDVDGIIIADLGLIGAAGRTYPRLPLHGSTQMSIQHPSALPLLKQLGIRRIVPARELNYEELRRFTQSAIEEGIEVEHFVHGALCMSVSGQCLLSAMIGGRSGNRGLCAQPCRLPFKAAGGTGNDLSLKDSSLFGHVEELAAIGVSSLKIEGRMKRPEYVALATDCCRKAVDGQEYDAQLLQDVFSRSGFTDGYHTSHLGREMFGVRTEEDARASGAAFSRIHELYRTEKARVPLNIRIVIQAGQPISAECEYGKLSGIVPEPAVNKPLTREMVTDCFSRLGGTPYYAADIDVELAAGLFVRSSDLKDLRRLLVERADAVRLKREARPENRYESVPAGKTRQLSRTYARLREMSQYDPDMAVDGFIIPIDAQVPEQQRELIVEIPRWISSEDYILNRLAYFRQRGIRKAYCNSLSAIALARQAGLAVMGGNFLNVANSEAVAVVGTLGAEEVCVSAELTFNQINMISSELPLGIIGYGRIPLMLLRNCPLKNGRSCRECDRRGYLEDRKGTHFPIRCQFGISELLNSVPVWLADQQADIRNVDFLILYFTTESRMEAMEVVKAYQENRQAEMPFTRGLYYRGVL